MFYSIGQTPGAPPPDAVFEAVINVLVAHKRTDLLPVYVSKMVEAGVHITAYIANFLINGYANVGDMGQAREIFESLSNPPSGVAAPNNHVPHTPEEGQSPVMGPVYREVSFCLDWLGLQAFMFTFFSSFFLDVEWEVMVRAELGAGNREAALELLERLQEEKQKSKKKNRKKQKEKTPPFNRPNPVPNMLALRQRHTLRLSLVAVLAEALARFNKYVHDFILIPIACSCQARLDWPDELLSSLMAP